MFLSILPFVLLITVSLMAANNSLKLEWDPNSEKDLAGYNVYYGTSSGSYAHGVDVGNETSCLIPYSEFESGKTYYFAATAYDESGNESDYSNEVSKTIVKPPDGFTIVKLNDNAQRNKQDG